MQDTIDSSTMGHLQAAQAVRAAAGAAGEVYVAAEV